MSAPAREAVGPATARIIVGDCRTVLPTLEGADVVITDPVWPNCPPGLFDGWDRPAELLAEALEALPASVKRLVVILRADSDPRFLAAVPDDWPFFSASWLQHVMPGFRGRLLGGNEIAYAFGEPVQSVPGRRVIPGVAPKAGPSKHEAAGHPAPRSLRHMRWLIEWWSDPGETVLDPFAGSGTIGLAACQMGREAVLIEVEPRYAEIARRRIEDDVPLFASVTLEVAA